MSQRKKIEIFTAGCPACNETVEMVRRISGQAHDIEILDMRVAPVAERARRDGIRSVPTVVIDGQIASCCAKPGPDEAILREALR